MCGITGYLDKTGNGGTPIGEILIRMMNPLCRRGPDSAGVAIFGPSVAPRLILRVKLGELGHLEEKGEAVVAALRRLAPVSEHRVFSEYLRVVVGPVHDLHSFERQVEGLAEGLELVSLGHQLEITKQVGSPEDLDGSYQVRS